MIICFTSLICCLCTLKIVSLYEVVPSKRQCVLLTVPSLDKFPTVEDCKVPGEIICGSGHIILNCGRKATILKVANMGDRPIQVLEIKLKFPFFFQSGFCALFQIKRDDDMQLDISKNNLI